MRIKKNTILIIAVVFFAVLSVISWQILKEKETTLQQSSFVQVAEDTTTKDQKENPKEDIQKKSQATEVLRAGRKLSGEELDVVLEQEQEMEQEMKKYLADITHLEKLEIEMKKKLAQYLAE